MVSKILYNIFSQLILTNGYKSSYFLSFSKRISFNASINLLVPVCRRRSYGNEAGPPIHSRAIIIKFDKSAGIMRLRGTKGSPDF